ncbi:MAG: peptidoglycan D,D-transpeptidase FtsI family protein [Gammaproteobacteria bacterium]
MSRLPRNRMLAVGVLFAMAAGVLAVRAVDLQIFRHPLLSDRAARQQMRTVELPAHRGMILDRRGQPLAISTPVAAIWVNPKVVIGRDVSLAPLARLLGMQPAALAANLAAHADKSFMYVARGLPPAIAGKALALGLTGVHSKREYRRYYPAGQVAAQVVGFTNIDDRGQYGLELEYEGWLQGKAGAMRVVTSADGRPVEDDEVIAQPHPGRDLVTSLDMRIQYLAYEALAEAVTKQGAVSGSIVVLDVKTGGVLAMVNQPSYNPNVRSDLQADLYRNRAVTDLFEPGSTFKPFIIAAALASGNWHPQSTVATGNGIWAVGGYTIHDDEPLGTITLTTLLEKSSNVGAAKVALTLPSDYLYRILGGFGFGQPVVSGFPGATASQLAYYGSWRPVEQAAISRGYGVSVTAFELAQGYLAIADGGVQRPATFIKQDKPTPGPRIIPAGIDAELRAMLTTVVSDQGTGHRAQIPNYRVAGKTGTAHIYRDGSYSDDRYNSVFVGMAPAADPRLVVAVLVRGASHGHYFASQVSAPVFREVMEGALRLLDIAPDAGTVLATAPATARGGPA